MAIESNQFPSDAEFSRIRQENKYNRLYESDVYDENESKGVFRLKEQFAGNPDKKEILAIALNTPQIIVDAGVDFLFGEPIKVIYTGNDQDKTQDKIDTLLQENKFQTILRESAISFQSIGHTQFLIRRDVVMEKEKEVNKIVIDEVAFDNWYPDYSGTPLGGEPRSIRIASFITQKTQGQASVRYIYLMEHFPGRIEHSLWSERDGRAQEQVPLTTLPGLATSIGAPLVPEKEGEELPMTHVELTEVDELLTFQIDTPKTVKKRMGKSLYKAIFPLLEEVNDRLTQMALQFWKNFDPLLEVPASTVTQDKNGDVKRKHMDIIIKDEGQPDSRYVTNDNPLVDPMFKYIKWFVLECAKLTKTPASFLTEDEKGAGVESAESLKTRFMLFLKRIQTYQDAYDDAIKRIIRLSLELDDKTIIEEDDIEIIFDPGIPKEMKVETEWIGMAFRDGLISRRRAIMLLHDLEGEKLDEELGQIEQDEKNSTGLLLQDE